MPLLYYKPYRCGIGCGRSQGHWEIEVKLHWHLDYSFREDENTTMDKTAFQNYSLLNKMALTLCKLAQPFMDHSSIRVIRKKFPWNIEEHLALLLNTFDDETILKALEASNQKKSGKPEPDSGHERTQALRETGRYSLQISF